MISYKVTESQLFTQIPSDFCLKHVLGTHKEVKLHKTCLFQPFLCIPHEVVMRSYKSLGVCLFHDTWSQQ